MGEELETVKISAASLRLVFHDCNAEFIKSVCQGRCCRSSTRPEGTLIAIHPSEAIQIEALGGVVVNGLLQSVSRHCPFQNQQSFLCSLHASGKKPFGCIASPFTLSTCDVLIVRNRYKSLKCYDKTRKAGKPAYVVFRASLDRIFGAEIAADICTRLDQKHGDFCVGMPAQSFRILHENDEVKRRE